MFTDGAIKVMAVANLEAERLNDYTGTKHILLGLMREDSGVCAAVFNSLAVDLQEVRAHVERILKGSSTRQKRLALGDGGRDQEMTNGKLPETPRATKAIQNAIEQARNLNQSPVGCEHLLLGLLCDPDGVTVQVLKDFNVKPEQVRAEVLKRWPPST